MALEETALICFSVMSCFGILALAYFKSEERKEQIRSSGITQRAQMKIGVGGVGDSPQVAEWWQPLLIKLLENPQVQNMIAQKLQGQLKTE